MGAILMVVVLIVLIGVAVVYVKRRATVQVSSSADDTDKGRCCNDATKRERKREAHYMRNFWSYDGSEQQEWEE